MTTKHLLIAVICLITMNLNAQIYEFSASTDTYTDITGSTSLNNGMTWDDPEFAIPIGFEFQYFDSIYTEIFIEDNAYGGIVSFNNTEEIVPTFVAYGADIIDRGYDFVTDEYSQTSQSDLSYLVDGEEGSRILKLEWNNVGFYSEMEGDNASTDYTNFQLWLYEGSNIIETRFGPNSITQPDLCYEGDPGSFVALIEEVNYFNAFFNGEVAFLAGDPNAPTVASPPYYYNLPTFVGTIPEGMVYTFEPTIVSTSDALSDDLQIALIPNPSNDYFQIVFDEFNELLTNSNILITNAQGQVVKEFKFTPNAIDISDMSPGVYFVQIQTASGMTTRKLVKK